MGNIGETTKMKKNTFKFEEDVSRKIVIGYDYKHESSRNTIRSCFIDGEEYFMVSDIADFVTKKRKLALNVIVDKLRGSGFSIVLNKWEMEKAGFFTNASIKTFTNKDGISIIIESTQAPNMDRIQWVDESILSANNEAPTFIKRELQYEVLRIEDLNFDDTYQRKVSTTKVREIVRQFDIGIVGALIVSKREDGKYYVVDGQHRIEAMRLLSIESIMCVVHTGLSIADEATLFRKCNNTRKAPSALDNFKADLIANNDTAIKINDLVESTGFIINVTRTKTDRPSISAVSALMKVYKEIGEEGLRNVLGVLRETTLKPTHTDIAGMGIFLRYYNDKIDKDNLIKKMQKSSPIEILSKSRQMTEIMGGHLTTNYAKYLLKVYNTGKQNPLEDVFEIKRR